MRPMENQWIKNIDLTFSMRGIPDGDTKTIAMSKTVPCQFIYVGTSVIRCIQFWNE